MFDTLYQDKCPAIYLGQWITNKELYSCLNFLAKQLNELNISNYDVIAIPMHRNRQTVLNFLTIIQSGITVVPLDPHLKHEELISNALNAGANWLLQENSSFHRINTTAFLHELEPGIRSLTSGTTSKPKCVHHSYVSIKKNAKAFNKAGQLDHKTVMLHVMPLHYMAGYLNTIICPLLAGGKVIIDEPFSPMTAANFGSNVVTLNPNTTWLSPSMLMMLLRASRDTNHKNNVSKICRNLFVGTAPLLLSQKEKFETKFDVVCRQSYGMTETMFITVQDAQTGKNNVGKPLDYVRVVLAQHNNEIRVQNSDINPVIFSDNLIIEDFRDKDADFLTGDIGKFSDNELSIIGREKDLIIRGGVNVSPTAIENTLLEHPAITRLAVIGVESEFWGEEIVVFFSADIPVKISELRRFASEKLQKSMQPSQFIQIVNFPETVTGKIKKRELLGLLK